MFEVLEIQVRGRNSLFELNEQVLEDVLKIILTVRTARVFELNGPVPYGIMKTVSSSRTMRPMSMLMLMFIFLKVSLKYGSTGAHSHTLRYYYFPYTCWVIYVTQLYL